MPSPPGTEIPLRLLSGGDLRLHLLRWSLAATGTVAILFTPLNVPYRLGLALCPLLMALWAQHRGYPTGRLELQSDGRCIFDGQTGTLAPGGWLSQHYAVLRVRLDQNNRHIVISASRQTPGEYRKLLAWMRLQPWKSD